MEHEILIKVHPLIFYDFMKFSENIKNIVYHITLLCNNNGSYQRHDYKILSCQCNTSR